MTVSFRQVIMCIHMANSVLYGQVDREYSNRKSVIRAVLGCIVKERRILFISGRMP